jgi:hypothetical protein
MALNDKYVNTNQDTANYENITKFDSFFSNRYAEGFVNGFSFIFITKPSLFLYSYKPSNNNPLLNMAYENMTKDQYFTQFLASEAMNRGDRTIVEQLSFFDQLNPEKQNFLPVFTNRARGFTVQDVTMEQQDGFTTKQGFRMPIPTNKTQSEASSNLSIPVFETPNLDVTKTLGL